jgi:uncharacterized membrane protein YfcA
VTLVIISLVAAFASALTFFSGFGLGTLLLPAFALFYPIELAVASTAVVHFLNGLFKLGLVGRRANLRVVLAFGVPAIVAALLGARLLIELAGLPPLLEYSLAGRPLAVLPAKFVVGLLLLAFTLLELVPRFSSISFGPRLLPVGGLLSGFFGGVSGMQGALRSAFLIRAGLSKEAFIGTGVVIACLIDISRLGVYVPNLLRHRAELDYPVLVTSVLAAFTGAAVGNRYLKKMTLAALQRVVAVMLLLVAAGLVTGLL